FSQDFSNASKFHAIPPNLMLTAATDSSVSSTPSSLCAKMLNIFVCPAAVFDEVLAAPPQPAIWRVPTLLVSLTGIILMLATATQKNLPPISGPSAGLATLSAAQAHALAGAQPLLSALALCLGVFAGVFWSALVLWFTGRVFLRTQFA